MGIASTPDGAGYWLVAADGGIFAFGDALFHGSMGGLSLTQPMVGIAADATTGGYWTVSADGGIFAFDTPFFGSMGGRPLNAPIQFMTDTPDFGGYRMVGSDGGVFNFGDALFFGSAAAPGSAGWEALTATPDGGGYWLFSGGSIDAFGNAAPQLTQMSGNTSASAIVAAATLDLDTGPSGAGGSLNAVSCPSATECVAVGQTAGNSALIEVSTDGADLFRSVAVPPSAPALAAVTCPVVQTCYAVGASSVLTSNDGGQTWSETSVGQNLSSVACRPTQSAVCIAVGPAVIAGHTGSFVATFDGVNWAPTTPPVLGSADGVSCTSTVCAAVGTGVYTYDNADTPPWATASVAGGMTALSNVSCIPGTLTCLAIGLGGTGPSGPGELVITEDNGQTWTNEGAVMGVSTGGAQQIDCIVPAVCGVAGISGPTPGVNLFVQTTYGGQIWATPAGPSGFVTPSPLAQGLGVGCWAPGTCVVVGDGGRGAAAQVTTNGGTFWAPSLVH